MLKHVHGGMMVMNMLVKRMTSEEDEEDLKAVSDNVAHDNRFLCVCVQSRVSIISFIFNGVMISVLIITIDHIQID